MKTPILNSFLLKKKEVTKKAFTLVELIVVITILAILWTIAFISLQWYSRDARDSVRKTDLASISKQLELMLVKAWKVYIPESKVDITASGTIISYQWEMWQDTLNKLWVNNGGLDPVGQSPYIYTTTKNLKQYELMWFLENWNTAYISTFPQTYAATNLKDRFPIVKWSSIWIFLDPVTKEPVNQTWTWIDIVNTNNIYVSYLDNSSSWSVTWTWWALKNSLSHVINPVWSCNSILKNWNSKWDWVYKIHPTWTWSFDVYCDMTTNWGGWTWLFSVNPAWTTWRFDSTQWTNPTLRWKDFLTEETTYNSYKNLKTNQIKICRWDLNHCYVMSPNSNRTLMSYYTTGDSYVDFSRCDKTDTTWCTLWALPNDVWVDNANKFFSDLWINYTRGWGDTKYWLWINIHNSNKIWYQADDGNNIWPSFDARSFWIWSFRSWSCWWNGIVVDYNRAISISRPDRCVYINPDDKMWYVLGK